MRFIILSYKMKDSFIKKLMFCVITVILCLVGYKICVDKIESEKYVKSVEEREEAYRQTIYYEIEDLVWKDGILRIDGWTACDNIDVEDVSIVIKNKNSAEIIIVKTELIERQDIRTYFEEYGDEKCVGFAAEMEDSCLASNECYEILVNVSGKTISQFGEWITVGEKVSTNIYLYNEKSYSYNPLEFMKPLITDEFLREVIDGGDLCDYSIQHGIWIYLYGDSLYYIIDSDKIPSLENKVCIPVSLYTNRADLVPEEYLDRYNEKGDVYKEVYLGEKHYLNIGESPYMIMIYELPMNYPVQYINTGIYSNGDNSGWLYRTYFNVHTFNETKQWD